jgi:hypothetical protein
MGVDQKTLLRDEIMLEMWLEHADRAVLRFVDGVSAILGLRRDELIRYMPEFLPISLLRNASCRQDAAFAAEGAVERIYEAFADHEAWDSYYASHAPSAYAGALSPCSEETLHVAWKTLPLFLLWLCRSDLHLLRT